MSFLCFMKATHDFVSAPDGFLAVVATVPSWPEWTEVLGFLPPFPAVQGVCLPHLNFLHTTAFWCATTVLPEKQPKVGAVHIPNPHQSWEREALLPALHFCWPLQTVWKRSALLQRTSPRALLAGLTAPRWPKSWQHAATWKIQLLKSCASLCRKGDEMYPD